jgi:hypothetical protein
VADSPVFARTCSELEGRIGLDGLAVRGTVRIALKAAGLDVASVGVAEMSVVLRRVLPKELETRGVPDALAVCEAVAQILAGLSFETAPDRAARAAETVARFGS